jgi:hypothetical protein
MERWGEARLTRMQASASKARYIHDMEKTHPMRLFCLDNSESSETIVN